MSDPPIGSRSRVATALLSKGLTARRAAWIIGAFTMVVTILGSLLIWLLDREEFPNLGVSAWWALQTVTTVGYGDYVPSTTEGRFIGAVLMVGGIGFLTVITASIAAAFVENARRRVGSESEAEAIAEKLDEMNARLERLERAAGTAERGSADERGSGGEPGGAP